MQKTQIFILFGENSFLLEFLNKTLNSPAQSINIVNTSQIIHVIHIVQCIQSIHSSIVHVHVHGVVHVHAVDIVQTADSVDVIHRIHAIQ